MPEASPAVLPDWDDLRVLLAVVRQGSFLAAAGELRMAVSTVSRRLGQLERHTGQVLVERRSDGAHVTPAGQAFAELAQRMALDLAATLRAPAPGARALKGVVRLTVGDGFTRLLMDCVAAFSQRHPQVDVEFVVESRTADLRKREADVAVRTVHKQEASLVYRPLGQLEYALWAAPSYVERHGVPQQIDAVPSHRFIGFAPPLDRHPTMPWLRKLGATRFVLKTTSYRGQFEAARKGLGLAALPRGGARGLIEVLKGESPSPLPLYLVSHPQALRRAEVRAFADLVVATVPPLLAAR